MSIQLHLARLASGADLSRELFRIGEGGDLGVVVFGATGCEN